MYSQWQLVIHWSSFKLFINFFNQIIKRGKIVYFYYLMGGKYWLFLFLIAYSIFTLAYCELKPLCACVECIYEGTGILYTLYMYKYIRAILVLSAGFRISHLSLVFIAGRGVLAIQLHM